MKDAFQTHIARARATASQWHLVQHRLQRLAELVDPSLTEEEAQRLKREVAEGLLESADTCLELGSALRQIAGDIMKLSDS